MGLKLKIGEGGQELPPWRKREWKETGVRFTHAKELSIGHGRIEERECWALADPEINAGAGSAGSVGPPWPALAQIVCRKRQRTLQGQTRVEVLYVVTSLSPKQAGAKQLLRLNRSYWGIENRLHGVRDETLGEDRSQVRTGTAPQVMAALRNLTLGLLRYAKKTNIAAALRTFAGRPHAAVALVLSPPSGVVK